MIVFGHTSESELFNGDTLVNNSHSDVCSTVYLLLPNKGLPKRDLIKWSVRRRIQNLYSCFM